MSPDDITPDILHQIMMSHPMMHNHHPVMSPSPAMMPHHHHHHPMPDSPLTSALRHRDFDQIKHLLDQGEILSPQYNGHSFSSILLSMPPEHATELVEGLKSQNIIPAEKIRKLLVGDIYDPYKQYKNEQRERLIRLAGIPIVPVNPKVYQQAMQDRLKRFTAPPSASEQALLEKIMPVWQNQLLPTHHNMIRFAIEKLANGASHIMPEPFSEDGSPPQGNPFMNFLGFAPPPSKKPYPRPSVPMASLMDNLFSGSNFGAGQTTMPRLMGALKAMEIMSRRPDKIYRWFSLGEKHDTPAYDVPDFYGKFRRGVHGVYSHDYIHHLGSNFTEDFLLAMHTMKMRNGNQLTFRTLKDMDIGFTLDNGDGHDVACRITFERDLESQKMVGHLTVMDSYPENIQKARRPGQDEAFKKLDTLIQAYFRSVEGWDEEDLPEIKTKVIYMNDQVNGYCTSNAIDHMLADGLNNSATKTDPVTPGWASTFKMKEDGSHKPERDKQGRFVADLANNTYFMKRTMDKLLQARLLLHLPGFQELAAEQKTGLQEGLANVYGAMRIDQVNSAEGRVHDYHKTRLNNQAWKDILAKATKASHEDPSWQQYFDDEKEYISSVVADSIITPVQIGDKVRLMDAREMRYYHSLEKANESLENAGFKPYGQEPLEVTSVSGENAAAEAGGVAAQNTSGDVGAAATQDTAPEAGDAAPETEKKGKKGKSSQKEDWVKPVKSFLK